MKQLIFYILINLTIWIPVLSQQPLNQNQSKVQLAAMYYRDQQYEQARDLYLELFNSTNMSHYFDYYITCLVSLKDYEEAEKALKKQIRKTNNPTLKITLGYLYKEMGDEEQSRATYQEIIDQLSGSKGIIINIGNSFFNRREFEFAEKTYLKGREVLPDEMFHSNLASVYGYMRDYDRMMNEYMALVSEDEAEVPRVQARINALLRYDFDNSLRKTVKREIVKAIQDQPEIIAYNRLLIWMFTIEKNYSQALANALALDRRTKTEEVNIVNFAKGAAQDELYDVALEGLNYLLARKPVPGNINQVKEEIVNVKYSQFVNLPPSKRGKGEALVATFEQNLNDLGYVRETVNLIRHYAHLLSFYLDRSDRAYEVLEKGLAIQGLSNSERSLLRIELADAYVNDNRLWEAALLYSRLIEANQGNPLGDEVQLKKARLSYYIGDINWARAQLDVLKASTSKLIANDAMELSMLIAANYDLDTIAEPIQQFARADLHLFQQNDSLALITFDSITTSYPGHALADEILMRKALINVNNFNFEKAAALYNEVIESYAYSTSADDAAYKLALLYENKMNETEKAQDLYRQILTAFPGSIYVADARSRFRALRGDDPLPEDISPYEDSNFIP